MKSLFKIAYKNMFSKKGRSFMLVLSVVLSAGLIYAVVNMFVFTKDIFISGLTKEYGHSNVLLYKDDYGFIDEVVDIEADFDYIYETNNLIGYTEFDSRYVVNMQSYLMTEFDEVFDYEFIDKLDVDFNSNYILIGENNSIEFELNVDDLVTMSFNGNDYSLIVYGIVKEGTTFLDESSNTLDVVVSKDFVENSLGITSPNMIFINSSDESIVEELEGKYLDLVVTDIYNQDETVNSIESIVVMLGVMAGSVVLISSFVIYSTYKIIVIERLPLLGTLRSIGANKKFSNRVLLLESTLYGLVGGIIGIGVGMLFLTGMFGMLLEGSDFSNVDISYFNLSYALITVTLSVFLSVVSSLIPIIKTSKYSIKEIMFKEIKTDYKKAYRGAIIGLLLILAAFIIAETSNYKNELALSGIALLAVIIGSILSISLIITIIAPVVKKLLEPIFKNKVDISIKNIKNDKTLINNIVLLAVGLGLIFSINNFSTTVADAVVGVYDKAQFDLMISQVNVDDELIDSIMQVDGVENVYSSKTTYNIETTEGFELIFINGISLEGYREYAWEEYGDLITQELLDDFYNKDSIILSNFNADKYELSVGDKIKVIANDKEHELEVIATISTILYNGNNSFINIDLFTEIFEINDYQNVYINVNGDIDEIKNDIKELYIYGVLPIESLEEMEQFNQDSNAMVFSLLRGISFLAMLIGSIGIINNFMVSFISRRKLIASLRSIGLSKKGTVSLFIVESLTAGVIGSFIGVMFGILFFHFMGYVIAAIDITPEVISYSFKEMVFIFVSGIILSVVAAILPAMHMSKQNIVKEIKYD